MNRKMNKMTSIKKLVFAAIVAMVGLCGTAWAAAQQKVPYQNWNPTLKQMMPGFCEAYKAVRADMTELNSGWYVVSGQVVIDRSKDAEPYKPGLKVNGDVHLILMDGAELVVTGATDCAGIEVGVVGSTTNSLTIYGQDGQTGKLTVGGGYRGAGIGGNNHDDCGKVTINGGKVLSTGSDGSAGIGGGIMGAGGMVTINGGTVNAVALSVVGGDEEDPVIYPAGAGIGGGLMGVGGTVTINGGEVTAISYPVDMGEEAGVVQGEGIGAGANMADPTTPLDPGTFDLSGYTGTHYVYAGMDTNGDEVTDVTNEDFKSKAAK